MNRPRIAQLGIALALGLGATAASAAHGDVYVYSTDTYVRAAPIQVASVERVVPVETVVYQERYVTPAPASTVVVERDYYVTPRERIVVQADTSYPYAFSDPRHPHWGHLIDYGLFNRTGPSDWGG